MVKLNVNFSQYYSKRQFQVQMPKWDKESGGVLCFENKRQKKIEWYRKKQNTEKSGDDRTM